MRENTLPAYDQVMYPELLHPQTHPARLAAIGQLFGLRPAGVENCRVLELGCGSGTNSIVLAASLPQSVFTAIDLAKGQIDAGRRTLGEIGLKNLRLIHGDVCEMRREDFGEFDYIIAHGFYSWTPAGVRDRALAVCRELLAENGLALMSYNTLPGFHLRLMMRRMMSYHTGGEPHSEEKVSKGLDFLEFLSRAMGNRSVFGQIVEREYELIKKNPVGVVMHDELEEVNKPVYFHEFIEHAGRHELRFVSELEYFTTRDAGYSPAARDLLAGCAADRVTREQYIDFLRNRRFRQTLLCRREDTVSPEPQVENIKGLQITAAIRPLSTEIDLAPNRSVSFAGRKGDNRFELDHPLTKAALAYLGRIYPRSADFETICKKAREMLEAAEINGDPNSSGPDRRILGEVLLEIYGAGLVSFSTRDFGWTEEPGEKPLSGRLARWQIGKGFREVINLRLENTRIDDELSRLLLLLADGTRTREELCAEVIKKAAGDGSPAAVDTKEPGVEIEEKLRLLAEQGLFVQ